MLTLNLLTTTIVAPPSNASKWQMGFNSAFTGLNFNNKLQTLIIFLLNLQQELKCCLITLPTNSTEQTPSWEADSSSTN